MIFFFYNTEMHAIIPHKDCLFFLSSAAGKIILSMNHQLGKSDFFVPVFPLWAFTEAPVEKIRSFSVLSPESDGREIFFPLKLGSEKNNLRLRIVFARRLSKVEPDSESELKSVPVPPEIIGKFPMAQRSFRESLVVLENNGWKIYDERWHKCK